VRTIGLLSDHMSDQIPASHRDLVECPPVAALTTVMADGHPQTSVVRIQPRRVTLDRPCRATTCGPSVRSPMRPRWWREVMWDAAGTA
jgi:predicted pyridoxine 5'-phosphate oxidase superfamily flavin-nucleotide-binding protein